MKNWGVTTRSGLSTGFRPDDADLYRVPATEVGHTKTEKFIADSMTPEAKEPWEQIVDALTEDEVMCLVYAHRNVLELTSFIVNEERRDGIVPRLTSIEGFKAYMESVRERARAAIAALMLRGFLGVVRVADDTRDLRDWYARTSAGRMVAVFAEERCYAGRGGL